MSNNFIENNNKVNLPHSRRGEVNILANEPMDSVAINRGTNRLLSNDNFLLSLVKKIANTPLEGGMSGGFDLAGDDSLLNSIGGDGDGSFTGIYELSDLSDVGINKDDEPTDMEGHILQYINGLWVSNSVPTIQSSMVPRFSYEPILTHAVSGISVSGLTFSPTTSTELGIPFNITSNSSGTTYMVSIPVENFNDSTLEPHKVMGIFVEVSNFGRLETPELITKSWTTEAKFPDGVYHILNSHECKNQDDDGGSKRTVLIPFDSTTSQLSLDLKIHIPNTGIADLDPLNYIKILGAQYIDSKISLSPDIEIEYLKVMLPPSGFTSAYIQSTSPLSTGYNSYSSSLSGGMNITSLSAVMPIKTNATTVKTVVDIFAFSDNNIGSVSADTGVDIGAAGCQGSITFDWKTNKITGVLMMGAGASLLGQGTAIFSGPLNGTDVSGVTTDLGGIDFLSVVSGKSRKIEKLPIPLNGSVPYVSNILYSIKHYNVATDGVSITSSQDDIPNSIGSAFYGKTLGTYEVSGSTSTIIDIDFPKIVNNFEFVATDVSWDADTVGDTVDAALGIQFKYKDGTLSVPFNYKNYTGGADSTGSSQYRYCFRTGIHRTEEVPLPPSIYSFWTSLSSETIDTVALTTAEKNALNTYLTNLNNKAQNLSLRVIFNNTNGNGKHITAMIPAGNIRVGSSKHAKESSLWMPTRENESEYAFQPQVIESNLTQTTPGNYQYINATKLQISGVRIFAITNNAAMLPITAPSFPIKSGRFSIREVNI